MALSPNQTNNDRFLRQQHAFPEARRRTSMVAIALGDVAPDVTRFLMAGAASMGVPRVATTIKVDDRFDKELTFEGKLKAVTG